jgi:hypothetical protein
MDNASAVLGPGRWRHQRQSWNLLSLNGWYDLSATISTESSYLRRFTGHYETGAPNVTG